MQKKHFVSMAWVQGGIGYSSLPGACQEAGVNIRIEDHLLFSVAFNGEYSFNAYGGGFQDMAVMLGYNMQITRFSLSFSGGISSYSGINHIRQDTISKDYVGEGFLGVGLALRAQAMYHFSRHFGTGVDLYASLSPQSQAMVLLNLAYSPFKW